MPKFLFTIFLLYFFFNGYSQSVSFEQKITALDREARDEFGNSVSVSNNYAIVGALRECEDSSGSNYMYYSGSAYIFEKNTIGNWIQVQKIVASDRSDGDYFGLNVAISENYCVVAASYEDNDVLGGSFLPNSGSAYIFERDKNGNWNEVQKIVASDRDSLAYFGKSVSISGNYIIVGAPGERKDAQGANCMYYTGAAYIYERDINGKWKQVDKVVASDRYGFDSFGNSVSISGNYAIVGAPAEDHDVIGLNQMNQAGSAYIFRRNEMGNWIQIQKIISSDRDSPDCFGCSVSISNTFAIVGADHEENNLQGIGEWWYGGSAYIFEKDDMKNWNEVQKIIASDKAYHNFFGQKVSIDGEFAIVAAPWKNFVISWNSYIGAAGAAYVFRKNRKGIWYEVQKITSPIIDTSDYFGQSICISGNNIIVGAVDDKDSNEDNILKCSGAAYIFGISSFDIPNNNFKIFPNPTSGIISIDLDRLFGEVEVAVYNTLGQLITHKKEANTYFIEFEINGSSGIYFVEIRTDEGKSAVFKVMKE